MKTIFEPTKIPINGIVFIYSSWSPTQHYLDYLIFVLNNFSNSNINLYIIDIDSEIYNIFSLYYNEKSHGYGETFWILNGNIVKYIKNYEKEKDNIYIYTREVLNFW